MDCPFCDTASLVTVWSSPLSLAFADRFPVSPGHTLIIPRRHVARARSRFGASPGLSEGPQAALLLLADARIDSSSRLACEPSSGASILRRS